MRRARRLNLVAALLMALAVLAGTSAQAVASLLCSSEGCPKQSGKAVANEAPMSCCPSEAPPDTDDSKLPDNCCCKVKAAPDAVAPPVKVCVPAPLVINLAMLNAPLAVVQAPVIDLAPQILLESDLSPPDPVISPVRGRAPPAA